MRPEERPARKWKVVFVLGAGLRKTSMNEDQRNIIRVSEVEGTGK